MSYDCLSTLTNCHLCTILTSALHRTVGEPYRGEHTTALWEGLGAMLPSVFVLGSSMKLLCFAFRCRQGNLDACGFPESACGGISRPADPQHPFFLQCTLISDVTALFEMRFRINPSTKTKTKTNVPWLERDVPLTVALDSDRFFMWGFCCCCWLHLRFYFFIYLISYLYPLAPGH